MKKYSLWKKIVVAISAVSLVAGGVLTACSSKSNDTTVVTSKETTETKEVSSQAYDGGSAVYMTKDISPEGLKAVYEALGRKATVKVAVAFHR